jgi:hypothetical protein
LTQPEALQGIELSPAFQFEEFLEMVAENPGLNPLMGIDCYRRQRAPSG